MNGRHEASTRDLVRNSLRMRPDRIIVGDVRGGEAFDMLQAMNTGHDGSMSTVHANSARDGLSRLESLILLCGLDLPQRVARDQLASSLHLLVHLERSEAGVRRIAQVVEIVGREGEMVSTQDVFVTEEDRLVTTRVRPRALDAMVAVRHQLPAGLHRVFRDPRLLAA